MSFLGIQINAGNSANPNIEIIEILPYSKSKKIITNVYGDNSVYDGCYGRGSIFDLMQNLNGARYISLPYGYFDRAWRLFKNPEEIDLTWHHQNHHIINGIYQQLLVIDPSVPNFVFCKLDVLTREYGPFSIDFPRTFFSGSERDTKKKGGYLESLNQILQGLQPLSSYYFFDSIIGNEQKYKENKSDFRLSICNYFLDTPYNPMESFRYVEKEKPDLQSKMLVAYFAERAIPPEETIHCFNEDKKTVFSESVKGEMGGFSGCFHQSEQSFLWFFMSPITSVDDQINIDLHRLREFVENPDLNAFEIVKFERKRDHGQWRGFGFVNLNIPKIELHVASLRHICKFCRGTLHRVQDKLAEHLKKTIECLEITLRPDQMFMGPVQNTHAPEIQECTSKALRFIMPSKPEVKIYASGFAACDPWLIGRET